MTGELTIPLRTRSEANARGHWRGRHSRAKAQRMTTGQLLVTLCSPPVLPVAVTLTRIAPRMLDTDNLAGSLKAVRDGVADWLGCGDGPRDPVTWGYAQERGGVREYAVRIEWREDSDDE